MRYVFEGVGGLACALVASLLALAAAPTIALEPSREIAHGEQEEHAGAGETEDGDEGESHSHHFHRNEIALILGDTYEQAHSEHLFTTGVEYERRFGSLVGLTGVVEYLPSPDAWLAVVHPTFHFGRWKLLAGVGVEQVARRSFLHVAPHTEPDPRGGSQAAASTTSPTGESAGTTQSENLFLIRIGFGYSFHLGERWSLAPSLVWDWVDEEDDWERAGVVGVTLGYGF